MTWEYRDNPVDDRLKELEIDPFEHFPPCGYDRFFLYKAIMVLVDHGDGTRSCTMVWPNLKLKRFMRRYGEFQKIR